MSYRDKYNEWLSFDEKTRAELESITDEKSLNSARAVCAELWAQVLTV